MSEIPFNDIMKNHRNWHSNCDFDIMSETYRLLKPVIKLMFFARKPEHPEVFALLFSQKGFAQKIIDCGEKLRMVAVKKIWFEEFSEEDREKLIRSGFLELIPNLFGATSVCFMTNKDRDELFINVIL